MDEDKDLLDVSSDEDDGKPLVNFWDEEDRGYFPETVPRSCTDWCWIPVYFVFVAGAVSVGIFAVKNESDNQLLWVPRDYLFQACGEGENAGKPYLYFCLDAYFTQTYLIDDKSVNTEWPMCVSACPDSWKEQLSCFVGNDTFELLPTYKTREQDNICEPIAGSAGNRIFKEITLFYMHHRPWHILRMLILRAGWLIAGTAGSALFLAVIYVVFVAKFVREIIWTGLMSIVLLPLLGGVHLFRCAHTGGCGSIVPEGPVAWVLLALAAVLIYCICSASAEIEKAIMCMRWSCNCVNAVASLKLSPVLRTIFECVVILTHGYVLICIVSSHALGNMKEHPLEAALGKGASFLLVALVLLWHVGLVHQINNMALIYAVESWFFQGGMSTHDTDERPSIVRGYCIAIRYHLGTCLYAGLVIVLIAPIRVPLKLLTGLMQSRQNPVGLLLWCCFGCVQECFYNNLEGLCSHSMYDVVLQSNPWCDAVKHSTAVIYEEGGVGHVLKEATWIFELAGVGIFAFASYTLSQLVLREAPYYSDPKSEGFIALPYTVSLACLFVGIMCSYPFMDLFRLVSDCILYCRTVERQRAKVPGQEAEPGLLPGGCTDELAQTMQMLLCMDGRS